MVLVEFRAPDRGLGFQLLTGPVIMSLSARSSAVVLLGGVMSAVVCGPAAADITAPSPEQPPGTQGLSTLLNWALWLVTFAAVIGVFITAGSMMLAHRRGEGSEQAAKLGWVLGGCVAAAGASAIVNTLL
jgi:hypothetical protein